MTTRKETAQEPARQESDAFGWTDKVEVPHSAYALLPKGMAFFTIQKLDRQRKEYGKFGTQNVAVMTLLCTPVEGDGQAEIQTQFALVRTLGWKIVQLATACGLRKPGDSSEVDPRWWAQFPGASGRCMIDHRKYTGKKDGKEMEANDITEFLAPEPEEPAADADSLKF